MKAPEPLMAAIVAGYPEELLPLCGRLPRGVAPGERGQPAVLLWRDDHAEGSHEQGDQRAQHRAGKHNHLTLRRMSCQNSHPLSCI